MRSTIIAALALAGAVSARAPNGRHARNDPLVEKRWGPGGWPTQNWPTGGWSGWPTPSWPGEPGPTDSSSTEASATSSAAATSTGSGTSTSSTTASSSTSTASSAPSIIPQNANTTKFKVDGTKIPDVYFDIGESYAGLLPISSAPNVSELYFWFFPSSNALAGDEILIWLNGGPGCSSLEGLLQENGPFLWQYGTYLPVPNPWTWVNLTNVVWVEQPAGTGFSQQNETPPATNEDEVAQQFLGFFKNFVDTFGLHGRKIYITGESYAGFYVPYIADAMHNASDTDYYNIDSIMFFDPVTTTDVVQADLVAVPFLDYWAPLFALNDSYTAYLHQQNEACGYAAFLEEALTFPPAGPLGDPPSNADPACQVYNDIVNAALLVNPCWDIYQVATTCPLLWDVLGFPGSIPYTPVGADVYFNRTDVQQAINAPIQPWAECSGNVLDTDTSPPSALSVLPSVIEKNTRTIIGHGMLDMVLIMNGTLVSINNMTWGGEQGFSVPPSQWQDLYVPYAPPMALGTLAGAGNFGKWHTERGLTFSTINLSGHMIPQYQPSTAYRMLEFLLGRISDLGEVSDFTTLPGDWGNGNATMKMF